MSTKSKKTGMTAAKVNETLPDDAKYLGVCVMQCPGAWTRMGPTWYSPQLGFINAGLGVRSWNTSEGLAELATSTAPTPSFHAAGVAVSLDPNLVIMVEDHALMGDGLAAIRELDQELGNDVPRTR